MFSETLEMGGELEDLNPSPEKKPSGDETSAKEDEWLDVLGSGDLKKKVKCYFKHFVPALCAKFIFFRLLKKEMEEIPGQKEAKQLPLI